MRHLWVSSLLVLTLMLVGCSAAQPAAAPTTAPAATAEAQADLAGKITVAGSTSVQPLAEKLAEAFQARYPKVTVEVQGGGTGVGVKSAGDGTVMVGTASRDLKPEEKAQHPDLQSLMIARDAIAIVVNNSVTVSSLTKDQIKGIFTGQVTNWKDVGGADEPIVVVSREEGSGTRDALQEMVLGKDSPIVDTAILQSSSGALRTTVATTPDSIGYISLGYVDQSLKAVAVDGVEATLDSVNAGKYPIVRPFNMLTKGEATGLAKAWLDYIMTSDGQQVVVAEKYIAAK